MYRIRPLQKSLNAERCAIRSISVKERPSETACLATLTSLSVNTVAHSMSVSCDGDSSDDMVVEASCDVSDDTHAVDDMDVAPGSSVRQGHRVRGSFHQGDDQFDFPGVQCMAIALVSLAKHNQGSVLSWQQKDLDRVLVLGDQLYQGLRREWVSTRKSSWLCVPELPKQRRIDGKQFTFQYGSDFQSGLVDVVEGELIENDTYATLSSALERILSRYSTCFLTLCDNTCAIICDNGQYAVVDSHARNACGMVDATGKSVIV